MEFYFVLSLFSVPSEMELQSQNLIMSELQLEELDLTKIWCFVPILNSQKWANSSIELPITQIIHNFW